MKKVIFTFSILGALALNSFGQACGGTSTCSPAAPTGTPGLSPTPEELPCIISGTSVDQIISFENFTSVNIGGSNQTVSSLRINSIDSLPAGLCWKTNSATNTFTGGQTGCIQVTGNTNAPAGQYKLKLSVTLNGVFGPLDPEPIVGLRYYVRVNTSGSAEFGLDTTAGKTAYFIPKASLPAGSCTPTSGINDINSNINSLTIKPNPMNSNAVIAFESKINEDATVTMTDMLGNVVTRKNAEIVAGENTIAIERNNAAAGVYFVTIQSKNGRVSQKLVIE